MPTAQVYVNWGRLVAECAHPGCGDARVVEIGQRQMVCCVGKGTPGDQCPGHVSDVEWPADMPLVLAALDERTSEKRKNWFPGGHPLALAGGYPTGQTPDELRAETTAGEESDAQAVASKRAELLAQLRLLGSDDDIIRDLRKAI